MSPKLLLVMVLGVVILTTSSLAQRGGVRPPDNGHRGKKPPHELTEHMAVSEENLVATLDGGKGMKPGPQEGRPRHPPRPRPPHRPPGPHEEFPQEKKPFPGAGQKPDSRGKPERPPPKDGHNPRHPPTEGDRDHSHKQPQKPPQPSHDKPPHKPPHA